MNPYKHKPITLKLELSYTFQPEDHLPDDWDGTREDLVEWFRSDIADNLHSWINSRDIYDHLQEDKTNACPSPSPRSEILSGIPDNNQTQ
jgi:hypothetical protein